MPLESFFMSSPPTFVKRTKSKTIRARDGEPQNENSTPDEPKTVISNFKNKSKNRTKPPQRLSFNVDDEKEEQEETFTVKKSSLSKRMKSGIGAGPMASPGSALSTRLEQTSLTNRSEAPRYDAQYLNELRASTNSARPASNGTEAMVIDSGLRFDASEMDGAVIENFDELPMISSNTVETIIPSEATVKAAKEKRDRSRKIGGGEGGEEEYISLDVSRREDMYQGPHPESRLMREDDDLGEGDDDDADFTGAKERIALSKKGRKEEAKQRKKGIVELIEEADEQDEEAMEWEMAQVKRAVPTDTSVQETSKARTYKPSPIPTPTPIPTLDAAVLRLSRALNALTTSHTQSASAIATIAEEHLAYDTEETNIRNQVTQAEEKRAWFQQFQERMETVGEFLEEKYPILEKLEAEHVSLLTERAEMVSKRRTEDNEDDLVLLFGVPQDMMEESLETDELGRSLSQNTHPQSPLRRERRHARTLRHTATSNTAENEGYSTDSTLSPSDQSDFALAIQTLKDKIQSTLFDDVKAKAFRDPKYGIEVWFGEWRNKYGESYSSAFGGMGLVQAWEFWGRVEAVGWLPFESAPSLEEFKWYIRLYEYSHPQTEEEEEELRPEDDLPVNMCSTMLIPRLNALILGGAFDPYSSRQMPHLIDLVEQIEASVGSENARFTGLLSTVAKVFRRAATDLVTQYHRFSPPLSSSYTKPSARHVPSFDPESIPARMRYMRRISKLIDGVMKWRRYTKERDGLGNIVTELVEVLGVVSEGGWEVGGEDGLRKVVQGLPMELVPISVKRRLE